MNHAVPRVSVVICAYTMKRLKDVHEAVGSVLAQTLEPHEVIVAVDHNEELLHTLRSELDPQVNVVLNDGPHRGSSATDNVGVSATTGAIIAFTDDDATAARYWLEYLAEPYQEPSVAAVGGKAIAVWEAGRPSWFCEELDWTVGGTYKGHPEDRTEVRNFGFNNASIRRQVLDAVGLLPAETGRVADWGTGFESQFFLKMKSQMPEAVILYEPRAVVYHKVPSERARVTYMIQRSYNEGYHKARVRRVCASMAGKPLSIEGSYLQYLLLTSIPERLSHFYRIRALAEATAITACIVATSAGYLRGCRVFRESDLSAKELKS